MQANVTMFSGTGTGSTDPSIVLLNPVSAGPGAETSTTRLDVTITSTATIPVEATLDGSTWRTLDTITAAGQYEYDTSGFAAVRAYPSANGSGVVIKGTLVHGAPGGAGGGGGGTTTLGHVGFDSFYGSNEVALPAGTPTYTAGDVMADSATTPTFGSITVARVLGGSVMIDDIRAGTDQAANVAQVRIHLYSVPRASLPTPTPVDDAANVTVYANGPYYRGYIDLPPFAAEAGSNTGARTFAFNPQKRFKCEAGDNKLYYLMQTNTGFARAAGQKITLYVGGVQLT